MMKSLRRTKSRNNREVVITTSWDDFRDEDEKLINLLYEYNVPATLYIPYNQIIEPYKLKLAKWAADHFEIGSHTINHPILTKIPGAEAYAEIIDSKELLEEVLHIPISSFCYPRGRYNKKIISLLKQAGYRSARTVDVGNTEIPDDPYRTKPTVHALSTRREYNRETWIGYAEKKLEYVMDNGGYFHLWGHAWEIEKNRDYPTLEHFLSRLQQL